MTAILSSLRQCKIDHRYAKLIELIYRNATAHIKLHEPTAKYQIHRGITHSDTISPKLFTTVLEYAFKTLDREDKGIKIDGEYLNHVRFADDIVITTDNLGDTKQIIIKLKQAAGSVGLNINFQKTQFMANLVTSANIQIDEWEILQVDEYKYMGH